MINLQCRLRQINIKLLTECYWYLLNSNEGIRRFRVELVGRV